MKFYTFCIFIIISVVSVQAWYTTIVVSGITTIKTLPRSTSTGIVSTATTTSKTFTTSISGNNNYTNSTTTPLTSISTNTVTSTTTITTTFVTTPSDTTTSTPTTTSTTTTTTNLPYATISCSKENININPPPATGIGIIISSSIITAEDCYTNCLTVNGTYFALKIQGGEYICWCYTGMQNNLIVPITSTDNQCIQQNDTWYGIQSTIGYVPPNTIFIYSMASTT